jgi:hypothetical protein
MRRLSLCHPTWHTPKSSYRIGLRQVPDCLQRVEDPRGPWQDMAVAFCFMRSERLNLPLPEYN